MDDPGIKFTGDFADDYHALCVEAAKRFPSRLQADGRVYVPFDERFRWCEQFVRVRFAA